MGKLHKGLAAVGRNAWWVLAAVFFISAVGKLLSLEDFARVTQTLTFIPISMRRWFPVAVPAAEAVVVYLLVLRPTRGVGIVLANAMLVAFTGFLIWRAGDPYAPPCECFGLLKLAAFAKRHNEVALVRNAGLLIPGLLGLWATFTRDGRSLSGDEQRKPGAAKGLQRRTAFTLTELLVVLGAIALLLGILLPALSRVRDASRRVACASNQRQICAASLGWAADHQGFIPLVGTINLPPGTAGYGSLPTALNDSRRERYAYLRDNGEGLSFHIPTEEHPAPLPLALSAYLGDSPEADPVKANTPALMEQFPTTGLFLCPDVVRDRPDWYDNEWSRLVLPPIIYGPLWWPDTDYAFNGGLLGFDSEHPSAATRLRGRLVAVRSTSSFVLAADADCQRRRIETAWFEPSLRPGRDVTLADALAGGNGVMPVRPDSTGPPPFDAVRHRGRANVVFVDGHVDAVVLDADALGRANLTSGVQPPP